jgi:pimeloyl-ACP methyl ester carboxylesterase
LLSGLLRALTIPACCFLLAGCASTQTSTVTYKPPGPPLGIVLVADGAGGNSEASSAISSAVKKSRSPLYVRSFDWSHGRNQGLADMLDIEYAQDEGRRLAGLISQYRTKFPNTPIYLVGHSAGTHVVLESTRWLPPESVDRIVLLAPAVSASYDLRPALLASRQGVDSFTSERDGFYLGIGTTLLGTADGERFVAVAGRVGFDEPRLSAAEAPLITRLHQHPWDPSLNWTGNDGSHYGSLKPGYLRAFVLPLFNSPPNR